MSYIQNDGAYCQTCQTSIDIMSPNPLIKNKREKKIWWILHKKSLHSSHVHFFLYSMVCIFVHLTYKQDPRDVTLPSRGSDNHLWTYSYIDSAFLLLTETWNPIHTINFAYIDYADISDLVDVSILTDVGSKL